MATRKSGSAARRASKEAHLFGKGSYEGLIASETGNSAAIPGSMIPTLTLALPGSAAAAVLIAAGVPLIGWIAWQNGVVAGVIALAAGASILRWPVIYLVRWLRGRLAP